MFRKLLISTLAFICVISVANAITVKPGDSMWKIAQNAKIGLTELIKANPQIENPRLIYPGDEVALPVNNTLPYFQKLAAGDGTLLGGTFNFVQVQNLYLSGSGITATVATITLDSFDYPNGTNVLMTDFGDIGFGVLEPDSPREENISFTGITQLGSGKATLTGVSRGLGLAYPYTASTTLAFAHAGGTIFRISNTAPFYNEFSIKRNDTTYLGTVTFASSTDDDIQTVFFGTSTPSYIKNDNGVLYYCNNGSSCSVIGAGANTYAFQYPLNNTVGTQVRLATSTRWFRLEDTNLLSIATTTNSGIDTFWKDSYNATTTKGNDFTFNATTTANKGSFGTFNNATSTLNVRGDTYLYGNATTTGSMDVGSLCFGGANCISSIKPSGKLYKFLPFDFATSTVDWTPSSNVVYVFPVYLSYTMAVDKVISSCFQGSSGRRVAFGLYSNDGNTKVLDSGKIEVDNNSGVQVKMVSTTTVPFGSYLFAWTSNNSSNTCFATGMGGTSNYRFKILNASTTLWGSAANASNDAVLPSTLGVITGTDVYVPIIMLGSSF